MKKEKLEEMRNKSREALEQKLRQERRKLQDLKFDLSAGKVDNVTEIRKTKKNVAQLLTLINEKD